jgi:hypothetical protein
MARPVFVKESRYFGTGFGRYLDTDHLNQDDIEYEERILYVQKVSLCEQVSRDFRTNP